MYARHDGTRSYFFNIEEMKELAAESGLEIENISYCERMTVNKKENVEAKRLFLQARFLDTILSVLTWSRTRDPWTEVSLNKIKVMKSSSSNICEASLALPCGGYFQCCLEDSTRLNNDSL